MQRVPQLCAQITLFIEPRNGPLPHPQVPLFHHLHPFGRWALVTSDLRVTSPSLTSLLQPSCSLAHSPHTPPHGPPALKLPSGFPGPSGPDVVIKPPEAFFPRLSRAISCHMKLPRYGVAVSLQHIKETSFLVSIEISLRSH